MSSSSSAYNGTQAPFNSPQASERLPTPPSENQPSQKRPDSNGEKAVKVVKATEYVCGGEKQADDGEDGDVSLTTSQRHADALDVDKNDTEHIHYKTMKWWHAGFVMIAETISLGVLALPQAVATLGLATAILVITILGFIAYYTGYVVMQWKERYPSCMSFADAGRVVAGAPGYWIMAVAQVLILVFIMAAHLLSFGVMMNALTDHGACTVLWAFCGLAVSFFCCLPRRLHKVSYLSLLSFISILTAVLTATIGIGLSPPSPNPGHIIAFRTQHLPFFQAVNSVLIIILAYAGHVAFFSIVSELERPRHFRFSLAFMQITATCFYIVISIVIYYYAGDEVLSPALGSAPRAVMKVAFGLAAPTIVIAGVVNGNVAVKYVWVTFWQLRGHEGRVRERSRRGWGWWSWVLIGAACWVLAWLVAEAVPNFNLLLGLIAALFSSWFSFGLTGGLWLHMNRGRYTASTTKICLTVLNIGILALGTAICVVGTYASGVALARGAAGNPFSCADNWAAVRLHLGDPVEGV